MSPAREAQGIIASDGLFCGPVVRLDVPRGIRPASGNREVERDVLQEALEQAVAGVASLIEGSTGDAADMLAFQLAMLEDDELKAPVLAQIATGAAADVAWCRRLDDEIVGYEASPDEYFRARAADLRDIRDRVLRLMLGEETEIATAGAVLLGEDIAPTRFLEADWSRGGAVALSGGSTTSHVAMLARARGVPMLVNLGQAALGEAREAIVDAIEGRVVLDPQAPAKAQFEARAKDLAVQQAREAAFLLKPARLKNGQGISLLINVAGTGDLDHLDPACCDGIGLMRSEFLFADGRPLPDEEQQYRAYRRIVEWAAGRPVTIRTLDIGGDKPVAGLTPEGERNPFLGLRGVRLTLARPEIFRVQLRALARAAVHGDLKIMIPMVTVPEEIDSSAQLLDQCVADLRREGTACRRPPLGIMVEVPAVAVCPELFTAAAFFSIGSNDLTQYVTAASRDEPGVASLGDAGHPAVLRLISSVAQFGRNTGMPVSLCGDMASDTRHLRSLVSAGLTSISVAPSRVGRVKAALAEI
jgi:phosphotransferase system enzyme I (PtsI)